ncbi:Hypothetical protein POVN_LOCUS405 [uncultured virus]|nr:Hypothetical protein POVN_LOCUS405 [uncultured virus]
MATDPITILVDLGVRLQELRKSPDKDAARALLEWFNQNGLTSLSASLRGFLKTILDAPPVSFVMPEVREGEVVQPDNMVVITSVTTNVMRLLKLAGFPVVQHGPTDTDLKLYALVNDPSYTVASLEELLTKALDLDDRKVHLTHPPVGGSFPSLVEEQYLDTYTKRLGLGPGLSINADYVINRNKVARKLAEAGQPYTAILQPTDDEKQRGFPVNQLAVVVPADATVNEVAKLAFTELRRQQLELSARDSKWRDYVVKPFYFYSWDKLVDGKAKFADLYGASRFMQLSTTPPPAPLKLTIRMREDSIPFLPYLNVKEVKGFAIEFEKGSTVAQVRTTLATRLGLKAADIVFWQATGNKNAVEPADKVLKTDHTVEMSFTNAWMQSVIDKRIVNLQWTGTSLNFYMAYVPESYDYPVKAAEEKLFQAKTQSGLSADITKDTTVGDIIFDLALMLNLPAYNIRAVSTTRDNTGKLLTLRYDDNVLRAVMDPRSGGKLNLRYQVPSLELVDRSTLPSKEEAKVAYDATEEAYEKAEASGVGLAEAGKARGEATRIWVLLNNLERYDQLKQAYATSFEAYKASNTNADRAAAESAVLEAMTHIRAHDIFISQKNTG